MLFPTFCASLPTPSGPAYLLYLVQCVSDSRITWSVPILNLLQVREPTGRLIVLVQDRSQAGRRMVVILTGTAWILSESNPSAIPEPLAPYRLH